MAVSNKDGLLWPEEFVCKNGLHLDSNTPVLYHCYADKKHENRLWMVAANLPDKADHIYVGFPYDTGSQGYAGRWLVFNLADQERSISLQGPWHSNPEALLECTGIDVTSTSYCQFVVGKAFKDSPGWTRIITDLLYYEEPCLQKYTRYNDILYTVMESNPSLDKVVYWHGGGGGSSSGTYDRKRDHDREVDRRKRTH